MQESSQTYPSKIRTPWRAFSHLREAIGLDRTSWEGARLLMAHVPVDPVEAKKILPLGMWLGKKPTATIFIAKYEKPSFSVPYHETGMMLHVHTPLGKGVHCPWMYVDDDTAFIIGRDFSGFPKKIGEIEFKETKQKAIHASVRRRKATVLTISGEIGKAEESPGPVFNQKIFNVGGQATFFVFQPIWLMKPPETILESYHADVEINLSDTINDPIGRLVDGPASKGRMVVMDYHGGALLLMVGMTGLNYYANTCYLRVK